MPINFFETKCQSSTSTNSFGICDDQPPPHKPAYIALVNPSNWIGVVHNPTALNVTFTAIDHCLVIKRPNGSLESTCDGMLTFNSSIIFVELKERKGKAWIKKADSQLRNTISLFGHNHNLASYINKLAYICNSLKPSMSSNQMVRKQKFKDDTGFTLKIEVRIDIP
jgi:hypothetical protein